MSVKLNEQKRRHVGDENESKQTQCQKKPKYYENPTLLNVERCTIDEFDNFRARICCPEAQAAPLIKRKHLKKFFNLLDSNKQNQYFRDRVGPRCDLHFVACLLRRYLCTLSLEDRLIYAILECLERDLCLDFRIVSPLVFGPNSKTYYDELSNFGRALHKYLTPDQVLAYFDQKKMWESMVKLACFDRHYSAALSVGADANTAMENAVNKLGSDCYDPRFVLRLLVQLVAPGTKLSCRPIIQSNALSFALAATSFQAVDLRVMAYAFLERFRARLNELSEEKFPQCMLYRSFLNALKNSLQECNRKTTHVVSQFLARFAKIILLPAEPLYAPLMSFLAQKPWFQLDAVPEFLKLFFSTATENCLRERQWILRLLTNGIVDAQDYGAICKVFVLESCMALFCTPLADFWTKLLLLKLFNVCSELPSAARDMVLRLNFFNWLANAVSHSRTTPLEVLELVTLARRLVEQVHDGEHEPNIDDHEDQTHHQWKKKKKRKPQKVPNEEFLGPLLKTRLRLCAQKVATHLHSDKRFVVEKEVKKRDEHIEWIETELLAKQWR